MHERCARIEENGKLQGDKVVELIQMERERKKITSLLGFITSEWKYRGLRARQGLEPVTITSSEV